MKKIIGRKLNKLVYSAVQNALFDHNQLEATVVNPPTLPSPDSFFLDELEARTAIDHCVGIFQNMNKKDLHDHSSLVDAICSIGLNNENLNEQPHELSEFFGTGIYLWQYPTQLASLWLYLAENINEIESYCEIGVRWGGTFIATLEYLKAIGCNLKEAVAVDPINESTLLYIYRSEYATFQMQYWEMYSDSNEFIEKVEDWNPSVVFIDGDHRFPGVANDFMLFASKGRGILIQHDVTNDACPGTVKCWKMTKQMFAKTYETQEFVQQYDSVPGSFLGIGVLNLNKRVEGKNF